MRIILFILFFSISTAKGQVTIAHSEANAFATTSGINPVTQIWTARQGVLYYAAIANLKTSGTTADSVISFNGHGIAWERLTDILFDGDSCRLTVFRGYAPSEVSGRDTASFSGSTNATVINIINVTGSAKVMEQVSASGHSVPSFSMSPPAGPTLCYFVTRPTTFLNGVSGWTKIYGASFNIRLDAYTSTTSSSPALNTSSTFYWAAYAVQFDRRAVIQSN